MIPSSYSLFWLRREQGLGWPNRGSPECRTSYLSASEFLQPFELTDGYLPCSHLDRGIMECWNNGILGRQPEGFIFDCSFSSEPIIIPLFHHYNCEA